MKFTLHKTAAHSRARRGTLELAHGIVETPIFMPVGTVGSVKSVSNEELEALGAQIILGNTYHLHLRPTSEYINEHFGSLHSFTGWKKPILTDSGGFQVFSLGLRAEVTEDGDSPNLVKITEEGAQFTSHLDGSKHMFTPESVVDIQHRLGSDIMMCLDVCPAAEVPYERVKEVMEQTHRWEERGSAYWQKIKGDSQQAYFGIVQGGAYEDLRRASAQYVSSLPFDGIAIGGVANGGESKVRMYEAVEYAMPHIPITKPRYLMGVGEPVDMIRAIHQGVDMFDCVLPTRLGRHGVAWIGDERHGFSSIHVARAAFKTDTSVLDRECTCPACAGGYSRAYLHHLIKEKEILGIRLLTLHNLAHVLNLFARIRQSIERDTFVRDFEPILSPVAAA